MYLFIIIQLFLSPVWETHGPYGGETICIAIDPKDTLCMYAGIGNVKGMVGDGVYRTEDGGKTWKHTSLNYGHIWDTEVDSRRNVYAATVGYGVLKSMDRGDIWVPMNNGLSCLVVSDIVFDPRNDSILYACTGDKFWGTLSELPPDGLYKSTDEGNSWHQIGFDSMAVSALAISPSSPDVMYLAVRDAYYVDTSSTDTLSRVYKSVDGGQTWSPTSLIEPGYGYYPEDVEVNPLNSNVVFVWGLAGWRSVWKSTNGGETWEECTFQNPHSEMIEGAGIIKVNPIDTCIVYCGWGTYPTTSIRYGGVCKSTDGGDTFFVCDTLPCNPFHGIAINPQNHNTIYVACDGPGIYKSTDRGVTWEWCSDGIRLTTVFSMDIDPVKGRIFAATNCFDWNDYAAGAGVYRSDDYGKSWKNVSWGLEQLRIACVRVAPSSPNTVYLAPYGLRWGGKFLRSFDGGNTWSKGGVSHLWRMCINPLNAEIIYGCDNTCGGTDSVVMFKSTDAGATFSYFHVPGSDAIVPIIDPEDTGTIYVGGALHPIAWVWKSEDGGKTWEDVGSGLDTGFVCDLKINPFVSEVLYAVVNIDLFGLKGVGKFFRYDGDSWQKMSSGLPDLPFLCIEVDSVAPGVLYLGTRGGGIYRSLDGGVIWNELNEGLENLTINCLKVDPLDHTTIYAGTNAGVYSISSPPGIEEDGCIPVPFLKVSPNPFIEKTVISYQLSVIGDQPITLSIYDITGRLAKRFAINDPRLMSVAWDGRDNSGNSLPPGVYFARLESGKTKYKAEKIVKLR